MGRTGSDDPVAVVRPASRAGDGACRVRLDNALPARRRRPRDRDGLDRLRIRRLSLGQRQLRSRIRSGDRSGEPPAHHGARRNTGCLHPHSLQHRRRGTGAEPDPRRRFRRRVRRLDQRDRGLSFVQPDLRSAGLEHPTQPRARTQQRHRPLLRDSRYLHRRDLRAAGRRQRAGRRRLEHRHRLQRDGARAAASDRPRPGTGPRTLLAAGNPGQCPGPLAYQRGRVEPGGVRRRPGESQGVRRGHHPGNGARSRPDRAQPGHPLLLFRGRFHGSAGRGRFRALLRHLAAARNAETDANLDHRRRRRGNTAGASRPRCLLRLYRRHAHRPVADARRQRDALRYGPAVPGTRYSRSITRCCASRWSGPLWAITTPSPPARRCSPAPTTRSSPCPAPPRLAGSLREPRPTTPSTTATCTSSSSTLTRPTAPPADR